MKISVLFIMKNYFYKCSDCNSTFSLKEIEEKFVYLCSKCGTAEKNKPLKGVLTVEYDYKSLRKIVSKKKFLKLNPGKFWQYHFLLPINKYPSKELLNRLELNSSPVLDIPIDKKNIFWFDDTRNPTLSYKDRASAVVALKALELGFTEISAASTGNAGSSIAGICSRLGMKSHIFVPHTIPDAKRIQIQSYGANIYLVNGTYDDAFDLCLEVSEAKKIYNRNTAYNPLTIEGKKTAAYDLYVQSKGKLPQYIFVPVGDGVILSGLFKGLYDLKNLGWIKKYPKIIGVQSIGSNALVRFLQTGEFKYIEANSIADSISTGAPRNLFMAAKAIKETKGTAVDVSDNEILNAQKIIAQEIGILVEPSSAASYAGFSKYKLSQSISPKDKVLLMLTGNGLKDIASITKWVSKPQVYTKDEIIKMFGI